MPLILPPLCRFACGSLWLQKECFTPAFVENYIKSHHRNEIGIIALLNSL